MRWRPMLGASVYPQLSPKLKPLLHTFLRKPRNMWRTRASCPFSFILVRSQLPPFCKIVLHQPSTTALRARLKDPHLPGTACSCTCGLSALGVAFYPEAFPSALLWIDSRALLMLGRHPTIGLQQQPIDYRTSSHHAAQPGFELYIPLLESPKCTTVSG